MTYDPERVVFDLSGKALVLIHPPVDTVGVGVVREDGFSWPDLTHKQSLYLSSRSVSLNDQLGSICICVFPLRLHLHSFELSVGFVALTTTVRRNFELMRHRSDVIV